MNGTTVQSDKPGLQSTEFWAMVAMQIILLLNSIFGLGIDVSDEVAAQLGVGLLGIYSLSRGIAKRGRSISVTERK